MNDTTDRSDDVEVTVPAPESEGELLPQLLPAELEAAAPDLFGKGEGFFSRALEAALDERALDFGQTLNIAVIGKVSSGKSSVINALLGRDREEAIAAVGAVSGVTTKLKVLKLDDRVRIVDSPGLDDIRTDNSRVTKDFLRNVDIGVFVIEGSADASQRRYLNDLRRTCRATFVVLNKVDRWDRYSPSTIDNVIDQWRESLDVERIYPTCVFGYDPSVDASLPLDIRGIDELRTDVEEFLAEQGKDLLLSRHLAQKSDAAWKTIVASLTAVAGEAFLPGSAIYITATQAAAVGRLYYLYTGKILTKNSLMSLLPSFAARSAGSTLFLWAKSVFPPSGILDMAAASVAVVITFAMLAAVNSMLAGGHELHEKDVLAEKFKGLKTVARERIQGSGPEDWKSPEYWKQVFHDMMYG
jgi:small GTP-binding protein